MSRDPLKFPGADQALEFTDGRVLAFSGPRKLPEDKLKGLFRAIAKEGGGVQTFVTGAQVGVDTEALRWSARIWPYAKQLVIVPALPHSEEAVRLAELNGAYIWRMPRGSSYLDRNVAMAKLSKELVAFPRTRTEEFRGSGTWHMIRHSRSEGLKVTLYPLGEL